MKYLESITIIIVLGTLYFSTPVDCSAKYLHCDPVDSMLLPSGNPFKCHEEVLSLQPMIPPKRFDISPPNDWGILRRSR